MTSTTSGPTRQYNFRAGMARVVELVSQAEVDELAVWGTRGDGKTIGALGAMLAYSMVLRERSYPLPAQWLGVAATYQAHAEKTLDSLRDPLWHGLWTLRESGHLAVAEIGRTELVRLRLVGVEDAAGSDRVRTACHGVWFEEPAPTVEGSYGLSERTWEIALTSRRLPAHGHVALFTSNYPDSEHWTWRRLHDDPCGLDDCQPVAMRYDSAGAEREGGCQHRHWCRIPEGEWATAEQRGRWAAAIRDPVLRARLIEGRPETITPGRPVATGFSDLHVARHRLVPVVGQPVWIGQDGGLRPASVIAQRVGGRIHVLAGLASEYAGMRQHLRQVLLPWLEEHTPWVLDDPGLVRVAYDPSLDTGAQADIEANALRVMEELLPARYQRAEERWPARRDPLLAALAMLDDGVPVLRHDPAGCRQLIKAAKGLWHYAVTIQGEVRKEEPKKPNAPWADLGDAWAYVVGMMAPMAAPRDGRRYERRGETGFEVWGVARPARRRGVAVTDFVLR